MAKEKVESRPIVNSGELGALLKEYRENAGYSQVQMADALCLAEDTIEKLENEEFQELAEPPYIRGYLRNYAKLVEADSDELINRYEALRGADPSELDYHLKTSKTAQTKSKRRLSPVLGQLFFLALLVAILGGISMIPGVNKWITETWNSFSNQTNSQESISINNPTLIGTMPIPTPLPLEEKTTEQKHEKPVTTTDTSNSTQTQTTEDKTGSQKTDQTDSATDKKELETNPQSNTENKTETPKSDATSSSNSDIINIKLVFNKEVWMRIRDKENKTLFEATNSAGKEKVLDLKKPLTFRVGNAQGLSLFVDGKPVDINGYIKGSVANFTLE